MKVRLSIALAILLAMVLPLAVAAQVSTYSSGFQLQNLDPINDASVTIQFVNPDGSQAASVPDTIPANSSKTYYPLTAVSAGFNGSVVIASNTQVAAVANVVANDLLYNASYNGFSAGSDSIFLPITSRNNFGISTWFNVQNTGSVATDITVEFATPTSCVETATNVAPGASATFDQSTTACIPDNVAVAATVTSTAAPVAAAVLQVYPDNSALDPALLAYNGFTSTGSPNPVMPLVQSGWYGSGTGIQVQNTGSQDTQVTISYSPSAGFAGAACDETKAVPAGASVTFAYPSMPAACYTAGAGGPQAFVGSGQVTGNTTNQPLVAVVNQVYNNAQNAAAYSAFDPAAATSQVSLPLIGDRNYGIFTGFSVANVGSQATDINCTFTGTSYTASATGVQPGEALTDVQLNKIADSYVGSAICTATGGDAMIAAVLNQQNTGSVIATEDGLSTSEGVNY